MFEITSDDIAALGDADLRILIGLLCEAEMRGKNLPTSSVTYGGNQDAPDGGLDVRVELPAGTPIDGFVPKASTGFQTKKPDMPRGDILTEMRPDGALRPVLLELAGVGGAYIIVSSTGSVADASLDRRRAAMAEAVVGTAAEGKLHLDFYDRTRVATWVRNHPGLFPWVRERIGKAMSGWHSHGAWASSPAGTETGYILDEHARIRTRNTHEGEAVPAVEGINEIRRALAVPGSVVRLVGLSGVGKTRLAEALFDDKIGVEPLDPVLAIYCNEADGPDPTPVGLASDLAASGTRAILVVDNCTPELHRRLSDVVRSVGKFVSVLSIEYDIREHEPEGTDVFVLDTSSTELIEKLVERQYPHLSQINARTVAEFSGGNARVALALASRIEATESVASLTDEELFNRLFVQRHDPDPALLRVAEACSLVYSFDGETVDGGDAELSLLGRLAGKNADEMYEGVATLKQRDLVQARAEWRAVLPHAIANRLAKQALRRVPPTRVRSTLVDDASARLLRSFSRRLGYLDDSMEARAIVIGWLSHDGLLSDLTNLNELGRDILKNIAPVAPEAVLSALETGLAGADAAALGRCDHIVPLLRSLAYDASLFRRAMTLMTRFAARSGEEAGRNEAADVAASLFHIALSGTHAPIGMRLEFAETLLDSADEAERRLGVRLLKALMETGNFTSHYGFDFGARSRDYGYYPATSAEVRNWFGAVLRRARNYALSNSAVAADVRAAVAQKFRGLWTRSGQATELDSLARAIAATSFWRDGWIAARQARTFDGKSLRKKARMQLTKLEEFLRPTDIVSRVQGLVVGPKAGSLDLYDFDDDDEDDDSADDIASRYEARMQRRAAAIDELAQDVAQDLNTFRKVLPDILGAHGKSYEFGEALAKAANDAGELWDIARASFAQLPGANAAILAGLISGMQQRDPGLASSKLEQALDDPVLGTLFPQLQASGNLDDGAVARVHRALALGIAPMSAYERLAYRADGVPSPALRDLVHAIALRPGGTSIALKILFVRVLGDREAKRATPAEVCEAGRSVLDGYEFHRRDGGTDYEDHELELVVSACCAGADGEATARRLVRRLMDAQGDHIVSGHDYDGLLKALFKRQPHTVLDVLFSGDAKAQRSSVNLIIGMDRHHSNPMNNVADNLVIEWCEVDPQVRYPIAAAICPLYYRPTEGAARQWSPLPQRLLQSSPDPARVLNEIEYRLQVRSWSGSRASKMEERLQLLVTLPIADLPALKPAMVDLQKRWTIEIAAERLSEQREDRSQNNRFE